MIVSRLRSVRGRITIVATFLVALTLLVASLFILRFVERDLVSATEATLNDALEEQAILLQESGLPGQTFEVVDEGRDLRLGLFSEREGGIAFGELFDGDEFIAEILIDLEAGEVVEVFTPGSEEPLDDEELIGELSDLVFDVFEVDDESGTQLLVGAATLDEVNASVDAVRGALAVIVPVLVLAFALMTWLLVGRALRPVDAITAEVEEIGGAALDRRVPVPTGSDEIAHLATVMNDMLDRLERSSDRQRRFTADASHELRTPLATIRAAAEVLQRQQDPTRRQRLADDVVAEVERMDEILTGLLALARLDVRDAAIDVAPVNLPAIARDVAGPAVDVDAPDALAVAGNQHLLQTALRNVIDNATRHAAHRVVVRVRADGDDVRLDVDDDGAGIPEEARADVLQPFTRLDEARARDAGGSGLGLAIVSAIAEAHGGHVEIDDAPAPVVVLGLSKTPSAGDDFLVVKNERKAREVAEFRQSKARESKLAQQQASKLDEMFSQMTEGEDKVVPLVIKADVHGSTEALRDALEKLSADEVKVKVVSSGVGGITESDAVLAAASKAAIIGFNVRADGAARAAIKESGVDIRYYSIIYEAIDDVKAAISGLLSPEIRESIIGIAEVKEVFTSPKLGNIAGCMVTEGRVKRSNPIRVLRDNVVIYEGELESLRRFKDDVNEVVSGTECGIGVKNYNDVKVGDQIECYERIEVARTLD